MSFVDVVYSQTPDDDSGRSRRNLTPYRAVFEQLRKGLEATVPVDTGSWEPDTITRTVKDASGNKVKKEVENPNKGRGTIELDHERGFRQVAKERDVGLTVSHQHMPNGKTILTLKVGEKRQFTPEALRKRAVSLEATRAKNAGMSVEDYRKMLAERKAAEDAANISAETPEAPAEPPATPPAPPATPPEAPAEPPATPPAPPATPPVKAQGQRKAS